MLTGLCRRHGGRHPSRLLCARPATAVQTGQLSSQRGTQQTIKTRPTNFVHRQNHVMLVARPRRGVSKAQKAQAPQLVSTAALEGLPARIATGRRHVPRPRPGTIARMQIRQLMGIRALGVSMAATLRRRHQVAHKRKELPILRSCPSHQVMADPVSSMARPKLPPPPPALLSLEP